ncbi:MAG: hypothetical protein JW741_16485 [Sedimentisphaerales bacterium]|nr:hypothetical protein [Sedimentisphaerales bacterium]
MTTTSIRILSSRDIRRALPMVEAVAAMKEAFTELSAGTLVTTRFEIETPILALLTVLRAGAPGCGVKREISAYTKFHSDACHQDRLRVESPFDIVNRTEYTSDFSIDFR